jgi:carboxymethylenebutenolidase
MISGANVRAPHPQKRKTAEMHEETVDLPTRSGHMETFVCAPERNEPHPVVILLMDAPGIREELRDMVRRLATVGYVVLLPNLYYRAGPDTTEFGPDVLVEGSKPHQAMRAIRTRMTIPPVMEDVADMMSWADERHDTDDGPVGVHGYCMSGPYALASAATFPARVAAAASFYGTWLVSDAVQSPHLTFSAGDAELYISCAEHDDLAPGSMVDELRRHFDDSDAPGELEIQPGVHHGFAFPGRWCYNQDAAERHWERLLALYGRNLGQERQST